MDKFDRIYALHGIFSTRRRASKRGIGYFYDRDIAFELPGVWFNTRKLEAEILK
ncbi:MAG: hypothetical protein Q9M08_02205 [Mariprofundus sp.]|nr:hypothetical protein [Mariprofundus sp.]